jgi:hypothetical protein
LYKLGITGTSDQGYNPKAPELPGFDPSGKTSAELLQMVKRTRQEEIRQKLEEEMTDEDRVRESM